jgi:hypothetical protein
MRPARQLLRSAGILAVCLLAAPAAQPAADAPPPAVAPGDFRARVAQSLASNNWGEAQRVLIDWFKAEPESLQALMAQAELFEKQGDEGLAYAVISHAVSLEPKSPASGGGVPPGDDPAASALAGESRHESSAALWASYRRLQNKLFHPDEAPGPAAAVPKSQAAQPATAPAPAVESTAAPAPAATSAVPPPSSPSGSPPPPAPAVPPACPEDTEFGRDPRGQWAAQAEASSSYGEARWSAAQATGAPDVASYGDNDHAWASKQADAGEEWLKVTFARSVHATTVRVRQTLYPGAVAKVEVFSADGRSAIVWSGRDPTAYPRDRISWFVATFAPPLFPVQSVKLTLDSAAVYGWNEIDAVQLVGDP